jgi:uncharacterized protein (UPF0335 family)
LAKTNIRDLRLHKKSVADCFLAILPRHAAVASSLRKEGTMSDTSIPGGRIRSFVERIEHLDTELQELNEQKKEVFAEAKAEGLDVKILKEIIKLRKQDKDERDEHETLLDLYMRAMETEERAAKAA